MWRSKRVITFCFVRDDWTWHWDSKHSVCNDVITLNFDVLCDLWTAVLWRWKIVLNSLTYVTNRSMKKWRISRSRTASFSVTRARRCIDTRWIEMTRIARKLTYDSEYGSDIVCRSYVVMSVLTFATVRSNVKLEIREKLLQSESMMTYCSLRWIPVNASSGYRSW